MTPTHTPTASSNVIAAVVTPPTGLVLPSAGTGSPVTPNAWWVLAVPLLVLIGSAATLIRQSRAR